MIKLIRRALEKRAEGSRSEFVFVEFNAWLYQGYDDARAALMEVIATTLKKEAEERQSGLDKAQELLKRVDGYKHCGRCVPCIVRRAAFQACGQTDRTIYVYRDLSRDSDDYARFDDVRSAAMAVAEVRGEGLAGWLGMSLSAALLGDIEPHRQTVERGLQELGAFLDAAGVT